MEATMADTDTRTRAVLESELADCNAIAKRTLRGEAYDAEHERIDVLLTLWGKAEG